MFLLGAGEGGGEDVAAARECICQSESKQSLIVEGLQEHSNIRVMNGRMASHVQNGQDNRTARSGNDT